MDSIFSVTGNDLSQLGPQLAVDTFRELLWAEATGIGIAKSLINVPGAINVADGGIDAEVKDVKVSGGQGIIKDGLTRYQIKAGDFSLDNSHIKDILFVKDKTELKPRIKSCLDKNGALVIVFFCWDNPGKTDDQCCNKFIEVLKSVENGRYASANVEIWRQNTICGFLKQYVSLSLKIKGQDKIRFQSHRSWSQQDDMLAKAELGKEQEKFIAKVQGELRRADGNPVHIRLFGEAGIGKTKLLLEATATDDLAPLVVYCDSADKFRDSDLMNELLKDDNNAHAILVIDECDQGNRADIWNKLKAHHKRIKLVSVYNENDDTSGSITYLDVPSLAREQISNIIQSYNIPKDQADRWAEFCSGSPRVAHAFGLRLKNNPDDLLKSPDTVDLWERYIVGGDNPANQRVVQRRIVLRHLALFKRFGYEKPFHEEAKTVAGIIEKADPQITLAVFQEIIATLRRRKILQGETTLYISPKALRIKLWVDWWENHGHGNSYTEIMTGLSTKFLQQWSHEMFIYARESKVATKVAKELLGEEGPFLKMKGNYLKTEEGAQLFASLAEADPEAALNTLKKTVGTWSKDELLQFDVGRRQVVWALQKIVVWKEYFQEAARLLLALGEAENETWGNNACGIFTGLFSPAYGKVAPTECPPQERFVVLKEAMESDSKERRMLALRACSTALDIGHFSQMVGAEHQGLRREPQLWMPKTYEELFDAYRLIWNYLYSQIAILKDEEQEEAINIILNRVRGVGSIPALAQMVINTVKDLKSRPYVDKKKMLEEIISFLHYDGSELPGEIRQQWEQLRDELTGNDFSSLMKRYVAMDVFEDKFDGQGNQVDQAQPKIEELADQAIKKKELLKKELRWLVTAEAENGYRFGYELGKRDKGFSLMPSLLLVQKVADKNPSVFFLGGYMRALFEKVPEDWEKQLDILARDTKLNIYVPELTWRSGMSDRAALRILKLAEKEIIKCNQFKMFGYGSVIRNLSEAVFQKWVKFLLSNQEQAAVYIAMDLYGFYYVHASKETKRILPEDMTLQLLTHPKLFEKKEERRHNQMAEHNWTEIAKAFVTKYPEKSTLLAEVIFEHFGDEDTIFDRFHSPFQSVIVEISRKYPKEVWSLIVKYLDPPLDTRAFHIKEWLRGSDFFGMVEEGTMSLFPINEIWKWVDADIEIRARHLAAIIPKGLFRQEGKVCLAREVLVRYGAREDVRSSLRANFWTEGWSGPASLHYQKKKHHLIDFRKEETDKNVLQWIDEYIESLGQQIERSKAEEERRGF